MSTRRALAAAAAALLIASCSHHPHVGPPHAPITAVTVLPVFDPTGQGANPTRDSVPVTLANAVRDALATEGIAATVGSGTAATSLKDARALVRDHLHVPALYIALGKWEAVDPEHPQSVVVALDAWLIDGPSGHKLWSTRWQPAPITARKATSLADAYQTAAKQVAAELVAGWHHVPPGSKAPS